MAWWVRGSLRSTLNIAGLEVVVFIHADNTYRQPPIVHRRFDSPEGVEPLLEDPYQHYRTGV